MAAVAIAILIIGYSFLKGNDVFTSENEFYAKYDRVDGLAVSKPVLVNGYQIGRVSKLTLTPSGQILVQLKVIPEYQIPKNTIARLESVDFLGSKAVIFDLGNSNEYAADGDTLNANIQKDLIDQIEPVQKKAEVIIARLDSVMTAVNNTLSPEFQKNFNRSFSSIARTLETLEGTTKRVDGLVGEESTRIAGILQNLQSISSNFEKNNDKITSIMANIDKVTDEVAKSNFSQTIAEANKAVTDLQTTINKMNTGEGSLPLLLNDPGLYNNLENAAGNLDKLMIDLKQNPKRYVHFSIFGRKE